MMGELSVMAFVVGIPASVVVAALVGRHLSSKRDWQAVAIELGLEFTSSVLQGFRIRGHLRGFEVEILKANDNGEARAVIHVHGVFPGFTLARETVQNRLSAPDIQIGDPVLDDHLRISGDADRALAVLGPEARRLVESLVMEGGGRLSGQTLQVPSGKIRDVFPMLDTVLEFAEILRRPAAEEIPRRLVRRVVDDPLAGVRLQAFLRLESSFSRGAELRSTASELIGAHDTELRFQACRVLVSGSEPSPRAARELREIALTRNLDSVLRRKAMEALARPQLSGDAVPAMTAILDSAVSPREVRLAAVGGLVRLKARDELLRVEPSDDPEEAEVLVRGLAAVGDAAQPQLLAMLGHPDEGVRESAARTLGRVGDVRAVALLRRLADSDQFFRSAPSRAAEAAIAEIKGRADGSQAGEISLASTEPLQGAVSPAAADKGGEVSLT